MYKLKISIKFDLDSPIHISTDRVSFGIDKAVYLDNVSKKPAIPATSIKGILRRQIENILKAYNINVCESPDKMCNECIVCKTFGSPKLKSPLLFQDAVLENSFLDSRIGVGIGRRRKTAKEDYLFSYEIGYGHWKAEIKGIFNTEEETLKACALIFIGAKGIFALGGGISRGLGWIKLEDFKIFINDSFRNLKDIEIKMKEVLGL